MILAGGKHLEIKASLHLFHESILFLGKDENQILARSVSENGNSFYLTISLSTSFFFCISHKSTKLFRWVAASSLGRPENGYFMTRFSIDKRSNRSAKEIIVVGIGKVTQFSIVLSHSDNQAITHEQTGSKRKRGERKREGNKTARVKWGRGKREANGQ